MTRLLAALAVTAALVGVTNWGAHHDGSTWAKGSTWAVISR